GLLMATAGKDGAAKVWDSQSGTERFTLRGHSGAVNTVAFSPDGALIATGSDDATVRVWDATGGREQLTLTGHRAPVRRLAFTSDGVRLASTSDDGLVKLWDPHAGVELLSFASGGSDGFDAAFDLAFRPGSGQLRTVSKNGWVRDWDTNGNP